MSSKNTFVCLNGRLVPEEDAKVSVFDRGFVYGDGLFTTIRAEDGKPFFLEQHLKRLQESSDFFGISFPEPLKEKGIIEKLLEINKLQQGHASVKIILTRGTVAGLGLPRCQIPTWLITARPYIPLSKKQYEKGWRLIPFCKPRSTPVANHKTLNYLYNLWARQWAIDSGADEAILTDIDGFITETATGSILIQAGKDWITPEAQGILPGITLKMLRLMWKKNGKRIKECKITLEEIYKADQVWILNSMIGIMPATHIGNYALSQNFRSLVLKYRGELWEYAKIVS